MVRTVFGRRGSGKTNLIRTTFLPLLPRYLIWDINGEYGQHGVPFSDPVELIDRLARQGDQPFHFVYTPQHDVEREFAWLLQGAWLTRSLCLVLDEIDMISTPTSIPEALFRVLNLGRHRSIDIIAASRRPAQVPRLLTSQSDFVDCFNSQEPRDLTYLSDYCGKDFALACKSLPEFHYLEFSVYPQKNGTGLAPRKAPCYPGSGQRGPLGPSGGPGTGQE